MRHFSTLLFAFIFMASVAFAWDNVRVQTSDGMEVNATNPLPVTFGTGNQTIAGNVYIGGNVGIGSVSPSVKLDVNGTVRALAFAAINGDERDYGTGSYLDFNDGGSGTITFGSLTAATPSLLMDFNGTSGNPALNSSSGIIRVSSPVLFDFPGNWGIGTSTPTAKLEVDASVYTTDDALKVVTGYNATRSTVVVNSNGNLGIGTSAPRQKLDIGGTGSYMSQNSADGTCWKCAPANTTGVYTCTGC